MGDETVSWPGTEPPHRRVGHPPLFMAGHGLFGLNE